MAALSGVSPACARKREQRGDRGFVLCSPTTQAVCQPVLRRAAQERPVRTSLDLELDLQASLTRQNRLNDELQALRGLRQKLEALKAQGETDLPAGVLEDERFQKLLKQAEKQVQVPGWPWSLGGLGGGTFPKSPGKKVPAPHLLGWKSEIG